MDNIKVQLAASIRKKAIARGEYTLSSGVKSSTFYDLAKCTLDGGDLMLASRLLHDYVVNLPLGRDSTGQSLNVVVGGPATGADPLVAGLLVYGAFNRQQFRGFMVRSENSDHGLKDKVVGHCPQRTPAVVIDDVATSGRSLVRAARAVQDAGGEVFRCVALLDRLEGAAQLVADAGFRFDAILTIDDLISSPI